MISIERRWFDLRQAAEYANCSVRTIRDRISSGELPRAPFGKRFLVDRNDLDALLEGLRAFP